ncbi:MAG: metallophosphoesterase [Paludibacteraceae bacterium]|nr:metallophosphoesterase [Paludibacteraceae bacterium]
MKKLLLLFSALSITLGVSAKTLVAYYSYSNNVETIVSELVTQLNADVMEIQPAEEGLDYAANDYSLGQELVDAINANPTLSSSYPAIKDISVNFNEYNDIIIATPLWSGHMAAPMQTFLYKNGSAMAGKNIRIIVSSESSGISGVVADAKRLIPHGKFSSEYLWAKSSQDSSVASMLNSWLLNTNQVTPVDDSKIIVLSDPHVMAPELLVNEGTAWTNYLAGQRKLVDYSKALFDEMIIRLKRDIRPGLVLITGDLSKDGETVSHKYVVSKLDELRAVGIKTLVIPGNHDRGANINAVYFDGESTTAAEVASDASFASLYANYGYGEESERDENSLSYVCEPITGLVVIGIDSGTGGTIPAATLTWVCNKAQEANNNGKQVIAMMHHPLIPHFTGANTFVETVSVADYANVRNSLADAGIRVIFTGHIHTSDIAKDYNSDLSKHIYDVNTGSLISYPCDYRTITLSNDLSTLNITTSSITEIETGDGFANTAKTRLTNYVKAMVAAKGFPWSLIASQVATAYIYHAEGDEYDNAAAQSLLSILKPYLQGEGLTMANSMLQDYSNYGDENRQDRTADRTLEITMPKLDETTDISTTTNDDGQLRFENGVYYDLQGRQLAHPVKGVFTIYNGKLYMIK